MNARKSTEISASLPSFPVRWFMFFRRYPSHLIDFRFLFSVIFKRSPIYWDNFMRIERELQSRKNDKVSNISPTALRKSAWLEDD
jgi:hypothetical protein